MAPRPECARCASAATMPTAAYSPLTMSAIEVPTLTRRASAGGAGSVPVIDISPDNAWMIMSYAGRCAAGPVAPNPLMAAYTRRALSAVRRSGGKPSRASVPGRKFSTSTSARRISPASAARPASCFRSSTTDRLPQFRLVK